MKSSMLTKISINKGIKITKKPMTRSKNPNKQVLCPLQSDSRDKETGLAPSAESNGLTHSLRFNYMLLHPTKAGIAA